MCFPTIYDKRKTFWLDFSAENQQNAINIWTTKYKGQGVGSAKTMFWPCGPLIDSIGYGSGSRGNWPKDNAHYPGGQHLLARDPCQEFMWVCVCVCVEGNRKTFFMHTSNL